MRVGVSGVRLSGQPFGIGRYIEHLLKHWKSILQPSERVIVYVRDESHASTLDLSDAFEVRALPSRLDGMSWEHGVLARRHREMDVLFGPSYTVPLNFRGRMVVATHSVNEAVPGTHPWWYHLTYRQRNRLCARRSDAVIVPSESVRRHVVELYGVPPDRIAIVPEGVDDAFRPIRDERVVAETRRRFFGRDRPYLLFVGKMSLRRNIPALLAAFADVKRRDGIPHGVLLYGPNVERVPIGQIVADLHISEDVVQVNEQLARHEDIIPVYGAADLYVFPSAYEGFSLTTVEAMACGVPVVTVARGAVGEIVDGTAFTVDEPSPAQLADAIRRALTDDATREALRAAALERSKEFRFSKTAAGTLDVLRAVARR